ncbi:MAG: histidine kinase [Christensenella sp.]
MNKKRSVLNQMLFALLGLMVLLFVILSAFTITYYFTMEQNFKDSANSVVQVYAAELKANIQKMNKSLILLSSQTELLSSLGADDEMQRVLASVSLQKNMKNDILQEKSSLAYIVYDKHYDICLDGVGNAILYDDKTALRKYTQQIAKGEMISNNQWNFATINQVRYLYRALDWNDQIIAVFEKLPDMFEAFTTQNKQSFSLILADAQGNIGQNWSGANSDDCIFTNVNEIRLHGSFFVKNEIVQNQLMLCVYPKQSLLQSSVNYGLLVVGLLVLMAVGFMLFIVHFMRLKIVLPMQSIVGEMEEISTGKVDKRVSGNFESREFLVLKDTTNQMLNEIVNLKIAGYEKQIMLKDMALKSIRLQLKPHFFLNALTTISSLSGQGKNESIATYINALSKNVRYMFSAGLHTVPIKDELLHVQNYFDMQELKYPGCVLWFIDMPQELSDWPIPQMLIHTFIENEYKYATSMETTLTILIKIRKIQNDNEVLLAIEIEDDGAGYPDDVLAYMHNAQSETSKSRERIGLKSIKQMLELMYEREGLIEISNVQPHGCLNKLYVPQNPIHELK